MSKIEIVWIIFSLGMGFMVYAALDDSKMQSRVATAFAVAFMLYGLGQMAGLAVGALL